MKIFIVTDNKYPSPSAIATHITLVAKILAEKGHNVKVIGRGETNRGVYNDIPFVSLRGSGTTKISLLFNYFFRFKKDFLKVLKREKPEVVIMYAIPLGLSKKLISRSLRGDFLLLNDSVEWYSKEESAFMSAERLRYYIHEYRMKKLLPRNVTIIAISQYLKNYFISHGNDCVYLPAVCDTAHVTYAKCTDRKKLVVLYAGTPGKKDLFEPIVKAISELSTGEREKLRLEIVGSNASMIAENANVSVQFIESLGDCVTFLPRMPHSDVLQRLEKADFTILIRPTEMRYAKAGFPTKVPESLSTGTPVICNYTSDLAMYLEDGVNAVIAEGYSTADVKAALKKALSLTMEQREQMYKNARKTAEERFDYRLYVDEINDFIESSYKKMRSKTQGQKDHC